MSKLFSFPMGMPVVNIPEARAEDYESQHGSQDMLAVWSTPIVSIPLINESTMQLVDVWPLYCYTALPPETDPRMRSS